MYVVGVTGGIGSGKSTLRKLLQEKGAASIDMDLLARDLIDSSLQIRQELAEVFGPQILAEDGSLLRGKLAEAAFADESSTQAMDAITLPHIVRKAKQEIARARCESDAPMLVVEMPILTKTPELGAACDEVIAVEAPVQLRIERCVARGMGAQDAANRIACQPTDEVRAGMADTVCSNAGGAEELRAWVGAWWDERFAY